MQPSQSFAVHSNNCNSAFNTVSTSNSYLQAARRSIPSHFVGVQFCASPYQKSSFTPSLLNYSITPATERSCDTSAAPTPASSATNAPTPTVFNDEGLSNYNNVDYLQAVSAIEQDLFAYPSVEAPGEPALKRRREQSEEDDADVEKKRRRVSTFENFEYI